MQESERIFIAENATLLRGSERELNRQLFTILNSIYDGLYITDGQANTILINRAYEEVSGLRREDVLGKSMQEIVATGMIDRSGSLGVLKTRKPVTLEQTFRTGKQALITSTPHFDSSGEITMIITVVRDMTEIYGLQRKYQESEERRRSEMEFLQRNQRFVSRMVAADPRTLEVLARAQKVAALDDPAAGGDRRGQGAVRAVHLRNLRPRPAELHWHQLRRHPGQPDRERVVRL